MTALTPAALLARAGISLGSHSASTAQPNAVRPRRPWSLTEQAEALNHFWRFAALHGLRCELEIDEELYFLGVRPRLAGHLFAYTRHPKLEIPILSADKHPGLYWFDRLAWECAALVEKAEKSGIALRHPEGFGKDIGGHPGFPEFHFFVPLSPVALPMFREASQVGLGYCFLKEGAILLDDGIPPLVLPMCKTPPKRVAMRARHS